MSEEGGRVEGPSDILVTDCCVVLTSTVTGELSWVTEDEFGSFVDNAEDKSATEDIIEFELVSRTSTVEFAISSVFTSHTFTKCLHVNFHP